MNLYEILTAENIELSIKENFNYLVTIIPEIKYMVGFEQNHPHHHLDVFDHTLYALSLSENDFEIRLCLLLHDIGKPFSYQEGDVRHFYGHSKISAKMSREILNRLNFDKQFIDEVCYLIESHDTPIAEEEIENNYELCVKQYKIQYCDALAHNPEKLEKRNEYLIRIKNKLQIY